MSTMKVQPGQMWEFGGHYYIILRPHETHKKGWYLFNLKQPDDTGCWDYEAEIINNFTLVA